MYYPSFRFQRVAHLRLLIRLLLTLGLIWLLLGSFTPGLAQEFPAGNEKLLSEPLPSPYSNLGSSSIPSEKVSQFVHAYLKVVALIERREGELQAAETESESLRIQQEVETEAFSIIKQTGLTQQEYLQLLGLANTDPEFGERVAAQLQEAMD